MYVIISVLLVLISFAVILKLKKYNVINKIPGPTGFEVLKLLFLKTSNEDFYRNIIALSETYGPVVKLWVKPFRPLLLIADPKFFERILLSKEHLDKTQMYNMLSDLAGGGLTTQPDVAQWKSDRKMFNSIFSREAVAEYSYKFRKHSDKLLKELEPYEMKAVDIYPLMLRYSLHTVIDCLTQQDVSTKIVVRFSNAIDTFLKLFPQRLFSICKSNDAIFRFMKEYKPWMESCDTVHDIIDDILESQKRIKQNEFQTGKKNLMDLLLESNESKYFMRTHLVTFITAGYETTASTMSFALFEISQNPKIQDKIRKEYLSVIGDKEESDLVYSDLRNMPYIDAVIKETMRMYPAVPFIQRRLKSPITFNKLNLPGDVDLMFSIPSLHRLYFNRPMDFDPDRFLAKNLDKVQTYTYAPFSMGPRDCIGRRFAVAEIKFLVLHILKHFTLYPVKHKVDLAGEMALRSKNGVPIIFKRRQ